jgi:alpha-ketoglutarate-dependent taurine dioxygenase
MDEAAARRIEGGSIVFETIQLTPNIGTEIKADHETLLSGRESARIRRLLEERGVIIFRALNLTDTDQVTFAKTLGEVLPQGEKGIFKVTLDKKENHRADYLRGAFYWHIDGTTDAIPTRASIMTSRKLSPTGGQTEFANTYVAYDSLPDAEKREIEDLRVVHSLETVQLLVNSTPSEEERAGWRSYQPKTHPLVWRHQSGRKSLVLGSTASHIEGMDVEKGRALLTRLQEWATQRKFVYQHEWTLGDLMIWDNTGTMHRALPYAFDSGRMMHRTTLVGEERLV